LDGVRLHSRRASFIPRGFHGVSTPAPTIASTTGVHRLPHADGATTPTRRNEEEDTMNAPTQGYREALEASEKIHWTVDDLIGGDKRLDFGRPFLPESLARTAGLDMLDEEQRLVLNQVRGHGYLYTFGLVEEFILPFVMDHARLRLSDDDYVVRALLTFAEEEAKHIHLFRRFREEFLRGFGKRCDVIGPPEAIAQAVLAHHPLGVALIILHIEWMTQRHYMDSVRDDSGMDPLMRSLLRHHWMEEAQHARLDGLMVDALAANAGPGGIERALDDYVAIGTLLDGGLQQQVEMDLETVERATGRALSGTQRDAVRAVQSQAIRWTFLGSGMSHPKFLSALSSLGNGARERVEAMVPAFS